MPKTTYRVQIALLLKRPLLLLDEPTAGLDEESARAVEEIVFGLADCTVVTATHDDHWAARADNVVVIGDD